jgi:hypothetical protein
LLAAQATAQNVAAARAIFPEIALPFSNFQGTISQMLRPFPQYSGVNYLWGTRGTSSYHAFEVTLDRRFSRGLMFHFAYTNSKQIDNLGGNRDPYFGKLDRALGASHRPHVAVGILVYDLPFGKGHSMGSGNAVTSALVSGWTVSGVVTYSSQTPLSITGAGCLTPGVTGACIASYNPAFSGPVRINGDYGSGNALGANAVAYLDRNAFINPAAYTFGDLPRAAPYGLLAPSMLNEDVSLRRLISIRERFRFSIEANVFNVTNSVAFNAPGASIDSANFGRVTSQRNQPRKFQLSARFSF